MVYEGSPGWYVELFAQVRVFRGERWRFRIVREGNHEVLAQSEGYRDPSDARYAANIIAQPSGAKVKEVVGSA